MVQKAETGGHPKHIDYGYNGAAPSGRDGVRGSYRLVDRGASDVLRTRVIDPLMRLPEGSLVVNLGAGDGNLEANIPRRKFSMVSVDQDPAAVASVSKIFDAQRNGRVRPDVAVVGDITRLDEVVGLGPASADAAVSWRVVHALPDSLHDPVFQQVGRILRPGGSFYVAALSTEDWKRHELEEAGQYKPGEVNETVGVMRFTEAGIPKNTWPLVFFSDEMLVGLGERAGLEQAGDIVTFTERTGFDHLARDPRRRDVKYRFVEFRKPDNGLSVVTHQPLEAV